MQRIDVPGIGIVEFPDGMSDDQIVAAIKANAPPQAPSPAAGIGRAEALKIAAGRGTDRLLQGLTQMYLGARGESSALKALQATNEANDAAYAPLSQRYPIVTAIGEAAPLLAMPVGGATPAVMGVRSAVAAAGIEGLGYGSPQERAKRAGVAGAGALAGSTLGAIATRAIKPAGVTAAGVSDDALAAARRIGYRPLAGQVTANPAMQNFENYLARSPGSSSKMLRLADVNQAALDRSAARALGEQADELSEGVFAGARQRLGQEFQRLQNVTAPDVGRPQFLQTLIDVDTANAMRGSYARADISRHVDKALELAAQGKLTGKAYKEIHTELANIGTRAFKNNNATLGQALKDIRTALDDAAKASLSKADRDAWDAVRRQWQAYKVLSKGNVAEGGHVSAARLAGKLRGDPRFRSGELPSDLMDVARVGEAFKAVQNPNSGQLVNNLMYSNPVTGLPMMAANNLMASAYTSRPMQSYMTRGLLDVGPETQALLTRGGGLLGQPWPGLYLGVDTQ